MAKYSSKDCGYMLLGSYTMLGATSKIEDTVTLRLNETYSLGEADETYWSSGAKNTELVQEGWFDDVVLGYHNAFTDLPVTALPLTIAPDGNLGGYPVDIYPSVQRVGYTVQMATSEVTKAQAKYGIWYGKKRGAIAFPLGTKSTAGNTDNDDVIISTNQPAGTNGGAMVLHVTALTGTPTNVTITLRHSTDGNTYADKTAFSAVTPAQVTAGTAGQYVTLSGQINKWVSVAWAYSGGTGPTVTFTVGVYVAPAA